MAPLLLSLLLLVSLQLMLLVYLLLLSSHAIRYRTQSRMYAQKSNKPDIDLAAIGLIFCLFNVLLDFEYKNYRTIEFRHSSFGSSITFALYACKQRVVTVMDYRGPDFVRPQICVVGTWKNPLNVRNKMLQFFKRIKSVVV
jgi:hypothetical protein